VQVWLWHKGTHWDVVHGHELCVAATEGGHLAVLQFLKNVPTDGGRKFSTGGYMYYSKFYTRLSNLADGGFSPRLFSRGYGDADGAAVPQRYAVCQAGMSPPPTKHTHTTLTPHPSTVIVLLHTPNAAALQFE
jgi:hypothetical protein